MAGSEAGTAPKIQTATGFSWLFVDFRPAFLGRRRRGRARSLPRHLAEEALHLGAQIGDGAAVLRDEAGGLHLLTTPQASEYVNETTFLVSADYLAAAQFTVALAAVLALALLSRQPAPVTTGIGGAPWWIWTGGVFSATFIVVSTFLTPRLGVAVTLSTIIVGQLSAALVVDHYGLFGGTVVRASFTRVAGVALLLAGITLMRWR